mgnify:CR=1 FL=1
MYEKGGMTKERLLEFLEKHIFPKFLDHFMIEKKIDTLKYNEFINISIDVIDKVYTNGTLKIQKGITSEKVSIRRVNPYNT